MRKVIIAIALVVVAAVLALFLSGRFSSERQRQRVLRLLNENGTVVRRACGLGEAHVDGARWGAMTARDQERAASALASWCAEQGGSAILTVFDMNTRVPLARWNGTRLESGGYSAPIPR